MAQLAGRTTLCALLVALATSAGAPAQTISPSGGVSAQSIAGSGVSLEVDPQKGASAGVDAGDNGGASLGAGPQGVQLEVNPGSASLPGTDTGSGGGSGTGSASQPSQGGSASGGGGSAPAASTPDSSGTGAAPGAGGDAGAAGTDAGAAGRESGGTAGDETGDGAESSTGGVASRRTAGRETPGVAPVIDLIEQVPAAVWAALASLALIALGLWLMWVRGRRRLERNAWVDSETPEMNVVAFETLLAQEWARSDRYRRPLGLLLLELEEPTSDGGRRPLTGKHRGDAQDAITDQARDADTVAQLSPSRFAVICPESSLGSVETMARALEHSLEAVRVHARVGTAAKVDSDRGPADLVSRAAVGIDDQPTWATPVITPPASEPESQPVPA